MRANGRKAFGVFGWLLVLGLLVPTGWAQSTEHPSKPSSKWFFWQPKEKPIPPAEQLFDKAMSYYQGRETWFRRLLPFRRDPKTGKPRAWAVRHNYPKAINLFQDIVTYYPYSKYAPLAELHVADCKFVMGDYDEAILAYEDFIKFHPVHSEVADAGYRLGLSHYHQRLKHQRDQTETKAALEQFQFLKNRYPGFASTPDQALSKIEECGKAQVPEPSGKDARLGCLIEDCRKRLAEHELYVGDFYFRQKQYWAAAMRYAAVPQPYREPGTEDASARVRGITDQALYKEAQSYDRLRRYSEAIERYRRVEAEYPDSRYAPEAKARLQALPVSP